MEELRTNRNLYEFVLRFMENHKKTTRTLEEYLCSLWSIVSRYRDSESLSLTDFVTILEGALAAPVPKFVPVCPSSELKSIPEYAGFEEWEETILVQIALLREMNLNGTLENEQRYFGVETPDGSSWYNFDPLTYLECGIVGAFDGWEPEDDTGRQLVPGKVLKNTDGGEALDLGPRDVQRPVLELRSISWADFIKFLECGRYYE